MGLTFRASRVAQCATLGRKEADGDVVKCGGACPSMPVFLIPATHTEPPIEAWLVSSVAICLLRTLSGATVLARVGQTLGSPRRALLRGGNRRAIPGFIRRGAVTHARECRAQDIISEEVLPVDRNHHDLQLVG